MMDFRDPQKNQNEKHYKKALAHCNDAPHERMPPTVLFFFFFSHFPRYTQYHTDDSSLKRSTVGVPGGGGLANLASLCFEILLFCLREYSLFFINDFFY